MDLNVFIKILNNTFSENLQQHHVTHHIKNRPTDEFPPVRLNTNNFWTIHGNLLTQISTELLIKIAKVSKNEAAGRSILFEKRKKFSLRLLWKNFST